jgi:uncharacterized protein (UPF0210 family)
MIEAHAASITRVLQPIATENEARFLGIDFSMAPYPEHVRSIGTALEDFGVPAAGLSAAAAYLADCLDKPSSSDWVCAIAGSRILGACRGVVHQRSAVAQPCAAPV